MSNQTRGVVNPAPLAVTLATGTGPIPEWPRGPLAPTIAPAWWWGNPPGSIFTSGPHGNTPAPPVTPEVPPAGVGPGTPGQPGGDCGCR